MSDFPLVLRTYIAGLKAHDVNAIDGTVADDLLVVTDRRALTKEQFLGMLRAIYEGFPDWHYDHDAPELRDGVIAVKFRQGGRHTGTFAMPGLEPVQPTGTLVQIPPHYFFYRLREEKIVEIRPEPVLGGAPRGIFEQIGIRRPPL